MGILFLLFLLLTTAFTTTSGATTCLLTQKRAHDAPSSIIITTAIHQVLSTPKHGPCANIFPTLRDGSPGKVVHRSSGALVLTVTRENATVNVGQDVCIAAFTSITEKCIGHEQYWGGNATSSGVKYTIYNKAFPKNWTPAPSKSFVVSGAAERLSTASISPSDGSGGKHSPLTSRQAGRPTSPTFHRLSGSTSRPNSNPVHAIPHEGSHGHGTDSKTANPIRTNETAAKVTAPGAFRTETLFGVTGRPNSYSQTRTTDQNGHSTVLPIWFGPAGAAVLIAPVAAAAGVVVPPLPGHAPLDIAPDGQASPAQPSRTDSHSASHYPRTSTSSRIHLSSSPSSSRVSPSPTSSSVAPTGTNPAWLIFPRNGTDPANSALTSELKDIFGTDLHISQNAFTGVVFWRAPLNPNQKKTFEANPVVLSIDPNEEIELGDGTGSSTTIASQFTQRARSRRDKSSRKFTGAESRSARQRLHPRAPNVIHQDDAPVELVSLSTPQGVQGPRTEYNYYSEPGLGANIYIFDSGANPLNIDYKSSQGSRKWIFVPPENGLHIMTNEYDDPSGHGTCMFSKAAGNLWGVAKSANVVVVKMPVTLDRKSSPTISVLLGGLSMIADDLVNRNIRNPVITISWSILPIYHFPVFINEMERLLQAMIFHAGAIIVVSAGNYGFQSPTINTYPSLFAATLPIINVGSIDLIGRTAPTSQGGPLLTTTAVGAGILCASKDGNGVTRNSGTSFSAPLVAGLAAYLLSVEEYHQELVGDGYSYEVPFNMKVLIQRLSYVRPNGKDRAAWNGMGLQGPSQSSLAPPSSTPLTSPSPTSLDETPSTTDLSLMASASRVAAAIGSAIGTELAPLNCVTCGINCAASAAGCAAVCLDPDPAKPNDCASCLTAAGASKPCVDCFPGCQKGNAMEVVDCTNAQIFKPCTGINAPLEGQFAAPGLCTWIPYCRNMSFADHEPCVLGQACDLSVAATKNCLPPGP